MMTSAEIRQSFLDFFREKQHTIVPSSPVLPSSPNLLFTNAGMNQFVPFFLGTEKAPYSPPRAADTQKCIRAGGKHNDLEDVGYDTYHHTFFEMLGNWSFGDYFKAEAIAWAWELVVERWGLPANRLYASVYRPGEGDPADFDEEAHGIWSALFEKAGLDPAVHVVDGDKKDNFWMMGDTGPCGPCSELHVDLTPNGDTGGKLVNMDDAACIEIWNLVFIQYNAEADGSFRPLPAQHVDTGMGFERVAAMIQATNHFTDFSVLASNYDTDVFRPLFDALAKRTGKKYTSTLPSGPKRQPASEQEEIDIAFRVIGDHIRTSSFAIADGIMPGPKGRDATIKAIIRRAVRYGRVLGFTKEDTLLADLFPTLREQLGEVFPELKNRGDKIIAELTREEKAFNKTLDKGLTLFDRMVEGLAEGAPFAPKKAVDLWQEQGLPVELTRVLVEERGLGWDEPEVQRLVEEHRSTGDDGSEGDVIAAVDVETSVSSEFVGFEQDECEATILETHPGPDGSVLLIVDRSPFYVEKGGQQGDHGDLITTDGREMPVQAVLGIGQALAIQVAERPEGETVTLRLDPGRRRPIEAHHTATHLLHWALHEEVSADVAQQGSLVAPDRLRFDFNSDALSPEQVATVVAKVNERIAGADPVSWSEVRHADIKDRTEIMQFFGDKYGEFVRVVQIDGEKGALDGYSMELCGGTHVRNTSECELFAIRSEGAISAGVRRIEAVCGDSARAYLQEEVATLETEAEELGKALAKHDLKAPDRASFPVDLGTITATRMPAAGEALTLLRLEVAGLKNQLLEAKKKAAKSETAELASTADALVLGWLERSSIVEKLDGDNPALLQEALMALKKHAYSGPAVLVMEAGGKAHLGAYSGPTAQAAHPAGGLVQTLAPLVGGKGGGKPEMARGAGGDVSGIDALLAEASSKLVA